MPDEANPIDENAPASSDRQQPTASNPPQETNSAPTDTPAAMPETPTGPTSQQAIDEAMQSMWQDGNAPASDANPTPHSPIGADPDNAPYDNEPAPSAYEPADFSQLGSSASAASLELLDDVELDVKVELGRTELYIEEILRLGIGSVVELDKLAGDPVDIYVNDRLVARGEVLVLNESFCVRVNDIINPIPDGEA